MIKSRIFSRQKYVTISLFEDIEMARVTILGR